MVPLKSNEERSRHVESKGRQGHQRAYKAHTRWIKRVMVPNGHIRDVGGFMTMLRLNRDRRQFNKRKNFPHRMKGIATRPVALGKRYVYL